MASFGKKSGIKFLKKFGLMMCIIPAKQKRMPNRIRKKSTVVCMVFMVLLKRYYISIYPLNTQYLP
jgi:hypothetical protein